MTSILVWIIGILGGLSTVLSLYVWNQKRQILNAKYAELKAKTDETRKVDAQVLANAQLITASAEADYQKAIDALPSDAFLPPPKGGGKLP